MTSGPKSSDGSSQDGDQAGSSSRQRPGDLADLARDLVDKVGIEGAMRYCHSLGWLGVLHQVELLKHGH